MRPKAQKGWYRVGVAITASFALVLLSLGWVFLDQHDYFSESVRARKCQAHRKLIAEAKVAMARANELTAGTTISEAELLDWVDGGINTLRCPSGGSYTLGNPASPATCSKHGP